MDSLFHLGPSLLAAPLGLDRWLCFADLLALAWRSSIGLPTVLASLWLMSLLLCGIGSLGRRMLGGVGSMLRVAAAASGSCFPCNHRGCIGIEIDARMVQTSWCRLYSVVGGVWIRTWSGLASQLCVHSAGDSSWSRS
jgi:hypothetical protein